MITPVLLGGLPLDLVPLEKDLEALRLKAGRSVPLQITALEGGRNNRLYRLDFEDAPPLVLKHYFRAAGDLRDRLKAEWGFLTFIATRSFSDNQEVWPVPEPVACDEAAGLALYSWISGRRFEREDFAKPDLMEEALDQAIDFLIALNRPGQDISLVPQASEAAFDFRDHIELIDRKIARLAFLSDEIPATKEAMAFVQTRLFPAWTREKSRLVKLGNSPGCALVKASVLPLLSPCDFGFHNALISKSNRVSFLDFEYAGLDDPAKLICDLVNQPEYPLSEVQAEHLWQKLSQALALEEAVWFRYQQLRLAHGLKWAGILLNEFLSLSAKRRDHASPHPLTKDALWHRNRGQIAKAEVMLERYGL